MSSELRIIGLKCPRDIAPGADLAQIIVEAARAQGVGLTGGDILVVTQKIVSKSEGRLVDLSTVAPSAFAAQAASLLGRDPRVVEVVLRETRRVVRMDHRAIITETRHGLVCANAGVDESNVAGDDTVALLPSDADASAARLRRGLGELAGVEPAVIISDTFGRPWREGFVNVAIGVAGMEPLKDYRGQPDAEGHVLRATILAVADELASAAELVMGKVDEVPVAVVRGYAYTPGEGTASQMVRPRERDMFR
ncbi:MAG: coenzyme F420-0:L-glutamate ligase [Acidobacteria bacterium]|nr:coenzyme F420-0:L-glutamate ligase [Acidobacteriota bacterium]